MLLYCDFYLIKIPVYILSADLTRNGLSLRPSLKYRTNIDYFLFIHTGSKARVFVCPRFFHRYVILTEQSNLSINFRVRLIKDPFTQTASDDAAMHAFLDSMKRRDRVFTLHAIKPLFPHCQIYICMRSFIEEDIHVTHCKVSYL